MKWRHIWRYGSVKEPKDMFRRFCLKCGVKQKLTCQQSAELKRFLEKVKK